MNSVKVSPTDLDAYASDLIYLPTLTTLLFHVCFLDIKHVNSPKQFTMKFMVTRKESNDPDHANKARKLASTRNFPLFHNLNLIIIEITDHPSHLNELLKSFFLLKVVDHEVYTQSRISRYSNFVKKVGNINSSQCTNER